VNSREDEGMKKPKVELNEQEWGQVLDGLACRVALYEETVGYYKHGVSYGHIAEVNGAEEAQSILRYYRRIIRNIKKQLGAGGYLETDEDLHRNIS
jgi:hypothetical protein